jgi:gamma-glutamyltranspeptidase
MNWQRSKKALEALCRALEKRGETETADHVRTAIKIAHEYMRIQERLTQMKMKLESQIVEQDKLVSGNDTVRERQ